MTEGHSGGGGGGPLSDSQPGGWWREMTRYHWWVFTVATLGWLFDSMDQRLFVLARTPALRELLPGASEAQIASHAGAATAIFIFGWATGGLIFGLFGDRWGRTRTMMVTILLYSLFTGLSALSTGWWDFALYRFLCGAGIGGEYAAGVALVAEVMTARARPYCLGLLQGLAALGHVTGSAVSLFLMPQAEFQGVAGWRLLFLVGILPSLLVVVIRLRLKEPEKWLRARELARAAGAGPAEKSGDELHRQLGDLGAMFRDRRLRFHLLLGMTLGIAGQVGIWGIGFWTPELIRSSIREERLAEYRASGAAAPAPGSREPDLRDLALRKAGDPAKAEELVLSWKKEEDRLVSWGTLLQDVAGMLGIQAFTLFTARAGRRIAFLVAYLAALGAVQLTFGCFRGGGDVYWMIPLLGFGVSSVFGGYAIYFPELFPTRFRSTGTGFCYNVARFITALGPLTLGKLADLFAGMGFATPLRPAAMVLSAVYLLGIAALPFAPETRDRPLPD